jgi:hypothetical protein
MLVSCRNLPLCCVIKQIFKEVDDYSKLSYDMTTHWNDLVLKLAVFDSRTQHHNNFDHVQFYYNLHFSRKTAVACTKVLWKFRNFQGSYLGMSLKCSPIFKRFEQHAMEHKLLYYRVTFNYISDTLMYNRLHSMRYKPNVPKM